MKKAIDILYLAKKEGVEILLNGNDLNVRIPKNKTIDESLIGSIRANKQSIIDVLKNNLADKGVEEEKIVPADKSGLSFTPLSFSQERLWFIHQMEGSLPYHLSKQLILKGALNVEALNFALINVVERHEILRTVVLENDGRPYSHVLAAAKWKMDISDFSSTKDRALVNKAAIDRSNLPFDISSDYMLRASLFILDSNEYLLTLTMHHIAADGWSFPIVVKEIIELYQRFQSGNTQPLQPLPIQFSDFTIWERKHLTTEILDKKLAYWKDKLKDISVLHLPTDYPRPLVRKGSGANVSGAIDKSISQQLVKLANQQGATLYMVMLSAFKVMLYRYTNQYDICVGASFANRSRDEIKDLVGFFVNTISFRSDVQGNMPFTDLLQQVKKTTLEAFQHQDVPFEKVVEAVLAERDQSRTPLFQVMLVLNNTPATPNIKLGGLEIIPIEEEVSLSKFDFTFFLAETADGISINVVYSTELFAAETISAMLRHYITLLQSVVNEPGQEVGLIRLITPAEENTIIDNLRAKAGKVPPAESVVDLFQAQVLRTPNDVAVVFEKESLTFAELNARANQLARYIQQKIDKPNVLIPVFLDRSVETVISILGILKAGHAYVPIEVDLPKERIDFLLKDLQAPIVISNSANAASLNEWPHIQKVLLQDESILEESEENLSLSILPGHLAYVIYTSGSTGQPKGVMIEHGNIGDYVWGLNERIGIHQCTTYALVSSFATDLGNTVIFSSLLLGGALHIISKVNSTSSHYLQQYFADNSIGCLKIVPSHWRALSQDGALLLPEKFLIFGGEALTPQAVQDIAKANPSCTIINHYGPTETTIGKLLHVVDTANTYHQTIPIGKPFGHNNVLVLSNERQVCPSGIPGQLFIGGDGVARGYLNNDELTSQKFIEYTNGHRQQRMYSTGDLVKCLQSGDIQFLGRVDDQVKIRGYRVELGEIENVLRKMPGIHLCAVTAPADNMGIRKLIAYITAEDSISQKEVQEYLRAQLPDYMTPSVTVFLEEMPLTINGKIDKKALPDPDLHSHDSDAYTAPRDSREQQLVEIWQQILEVEPIGIHNDFFVLGGHSLLAVRLISLIRKEFNVEIPISHVFDFPTIALLAEQLKIEDKGEQLAAITPVHPRPVHCPLSFSQERLWFIDQLDGSLQYHIPLVLRLKGNLNRPALDYALQTVINRHEVLRTVFVSADDQVSQVIKEENSWQLNFISSNDYVNDEQALQKYIQQLIDKPFDLAKDDLLRADLIELTANEFILVISLHHIVSDGWSSSILGREVAETYNAFIEERKPSLPVLPIQYADFSIWQRNHIQGAVLNTQVDYWKNKLAGVEPLQIPTDFSRPSVQSIKGSLVSFKIEAAVAEALQQISLQHGSTLFMTLLAALKVLLYRYSGQKDICIGTPIAGRNRHETEGLIGFFINTLALRTIVDPTADFKQLLNDVRATAMEAFAHQDAPFEKVVEAVIKERDISRSPLFQVLFVFQNTPEIEEFNFDGLEVIGENTGHTSSKFDISFTLRQHDNGIDGSIEYCTDLFREETILSLVAHLRELLVSIIDDSSQKVGKLSLLSSSEEHRLLQEFAGKVFPHPPTPLHQQIESQSLRTPHAIAIKDEGGQLTYRVLNERSTQLSQYLVQKGAGAGIIVPVLMERTAEMMVALLGILKSGAAYVPIDPLYPQDRISYMIAEAGATIAISSGAYKSLLPQNLEVIDLVKDWEIISQQPSSSQTTTNNDQLAFVQPALAYVIYTSGSTGRPKGVMISHASASSFIHWCKEEFSDTTFDTVYAGTSISFDLSVFELFYTLSVGKTIRLLQNGLEAPKYLNQDSNVLLNTVPSVIESLLKEQTDLSHVTAINMAGEPVSAYVQLHLDQQKITVRNLYGPSEDTTYSTVYRMHNGQPLLIGKPIHNTTIYILNQESQLQPVGIAGEICIGGKGLALGYLNQPGLTAEKFVPNPYKKDERLYKTGDLGRWTKGGNIDYLGRIDDQVKVRGYRIEPGEIESVLQHSGQVTQVAVLALTNPQGNKYLRAFVVPKKEEIFQQNQLQQYAANRLPDFMVPKSWVQLDSLPLTPNGKIDRKALALSAQGVEIASGKYEAPLTDIEIALAAVWSGLLGKEQIGVHDNFFELGGDSILTIQAVSRINKLGYHLQPRDIFQHQTISRLSKFLNKNQASTVTVEQGQLTGFAGLLPIQQWYLQNATEEKSHFNQSVLLQISKEITSEMLGRALEALIAQHDALRFKYSKQAGELLQEYGTFICGLVVEELQEATDVPSSVNAIADKYQRSLNIEKGDLVKVVWIQTPTAESNNRLLFIIHHLAVDGVSWRILLEDIESLLNAFHKGLEYTKPTKTSSYRQWFNALQQYGQSQAVQRQVPYWKLAQQSPSRIKTDKIYDGILLVSDFDNVGLSLEADITTLLLNEVPKVYHTRINDILLAALSRTFNLHQSTDKLLIALEGHGREDISNTIDISRTVGWFTSLYPLLLQNGYNDNYDQLIKNTKEQIRKIPGMGLGYGVLKYINKHPDLKGEDSWEIIFNYFGQFDNVVNKSNWFAGANELDGASKSKDVIVNEKISITAHVQEGKLFTSWSFSTKHFNTKTIETLAASYLHIMSELVKHCTSAIDANSQVLTPSDYGMTNEITVEHLDNFLKDQEQEDIFTF